MLAKGPVGLLLPGTIAVVYLAWEGRLWMLLDRRMVWAVVMFLLVAAPWYVAVGVQTHWLFLKEFFWRHHIERGTTAMEGHQGTVLYYPLVLIIGTMPWSIFLGATVVMAYWSCMRMPTEPRTPTSWWWAVLTAPHRAVQTFWWQRLRPGSAGNATWRRLQDPAGRGGVAAYRFLAVWALVYLVFFSVAATKLPNYVLPMTMPLAVLTARLLDRWRRGLVEVPAWYRNACLAALVLVGVGVGVGMAIAGHRSLPAVAPFAWVGVVPVVAAIVLMRLTARGRRDAAAYAFAASAVLLLAPLAAWMSVALNDCKSPAPLARDSGLGRRDVDLRIGTYLAEHIPSLNFYARRDVIPLGDAASFVDFLKLPVPAYVVISEEKLAELRAKNVSLGRETARHYDMYRRQAMVVVTNQ
jgi:4-amino-4-deoxy-L-arabinose transferase-like glycosyltransferase